MAIFAVDLMFCIREKERRCCWMIIDRVWIALGEVRVLKVCKLSFHYVNDSDEPESPGCLTPLWCGKLVLGMREEEHYCWMIIDRVWAVCDYNIW